MRREIRTHHEIAMVLAIKDTQREIHKLFLASQNVMVGNQTMAQVFADDRTAQDAKGI